jgi:hypothetical protein
MSCSSTVTARADAQQPDGAPQIEATWAAMVATHFISLLVG